MTMSCSSDSLQNFSGQAPLFPLPNVVLFPQASLPLHIFEPRYRQMTADALDGERLIAMALIMSANQSPASMGVEPQLHSLVGLGRIVTHERLEDGRYMLVLRGVGRARIIREELTSAPYRIGKLELCHEVIPVPADFDRSIRAEEIVALFCRLFPGVEFQRILRHSMTSDLPLGQVCDIIASTLPIAPQLAQMFLEEPNCDTRSQMMWQLLKRMESSRQSTISPADRFPPDFSRN